MSNHPIAALLTLVSAIVVLAGCGSGGGGGAGGSSSSSSPQYINGTATGQFGDNDLGFFQGALTVPATITTATAAPKLRFDIGNGFHTTVNSIHFSVLKNGIAFTTGTVPTLAAFGFTTIDIPISATVGASVYRIVIDDANAVSETNENNNFVEFTVTVAASG